MSFQKYRVFFNYTRFFFICFTSLLQDIDNQPFFTTMKYNSREKSTTI